MEKGDKEIEGHCTEQAKKLGTTFASSDTYSKNACLSCFINLFVFSPFERE